MEILNGLLITKITQKNKQKHNMRKSKRIHRTEKRFPAEYTIKYVEVKSKSRAGIEYIHYKPITVLKENEENTKNT